MNKLLLNHCKSIGSTHSKAMLTKLAVNNLNYRIPSNVRVLRKTSRNLIVNANQTETSLQNLCLHKNGQSDSLSLISHTLSHPE